MSDVEPELDPVAEQEKYLPPATTEGLSLLRKVLIYHLGITALIVLLAVVFPSFLDHMPIGGLDKLAGGTSVDFSDFSHPDDDEYDGEIVSSIIKAGNTFDRLGYARDLIIVLISVWFLVIPVSWVHKGIHKASSHDHSLDETTLILPGVVAAIVMVVQHSLALAFSLAGIIAGVQFRRALQDTFDALFILVAIGAGLSAGIGALEITTVLTVFFCYATLYVYYLGDGLESHYEARRKAEKERRKQAERALENS